jgi:tetratricopeptide (TPR) repeat protein
VKKNQLLWGALLAILVATFAAYVPSIDGEFQYDDQEIAKQVWVRQAERFLEPSFWWTMPRPLTGALFAVDHKIDGFHPRVWHVTNVLIHLAVVVLVWRVARRILARAGVAPGPAIAPTEEPAAGKGKKGKGRRAAEAVVLAVPEWPALAVAALFALHPLHTEAVSYLSQRSEALASAFVLGALLALLRWDETKPGERWHWLVAGVALHGLGLAAKPIAAPLPAVWLLAAAVLPLPVERGLGWWERVKRRLLPAVPLLALSLYAATSGVKDASGSGHAGFDLAFVTPFQYVATQMRALPIYVRLVLAPYGLNADWLFPFSKSFGEWPVLAGLAFVVVVTAVAVWAFLRWGEGEGDGPVAARLGAFGWLFFLGMLSTTTLVPLRDPFVEHRLYLPTLGIVFAVTGLLLLAIRRLAPSRGWAVAGVAAVSLAAGLGTATYYRNDVWRSAINLWKDASEKSPDKPRIWVNYGTALHFAGRYDEAVRAYDRAVGLGFDPTVPMELVVRNTALALVRLRRYDEARLRLERYLQGAPRDAGTIVILALVQVDTGLLDDAERSARAALALDRTQSRPYQILGQVQEKRGDLQGAIDQFAMASRIDPSDPLPVYSIGRIEEKRGRVDEACRFYARATDSLARSSAGRSANEAYGRLCAGRFGPLQ